MKEIMTNVSECDDADMAESEGSNNMMIPCLLGAVLLIVFILCLLILWQKVSGRNKTEIKAQTYTNTSSTEAVLSGADSGLSEAGMISGKDGATYETAGTPEETMLQQYMAELETLKERVESSLQTMLETKETLLEAADSQSGNTVIKEELSEITNEITELTLQLEDAQTRIDELEESINVINSETITVIQENISEIEQQISDIDNDILDIYTKISDLKTADAELQNKIDEMGSSLKTAAEQNMTNVTNQFNDVNNKMQQMELERLQYLYDAGSGTLHLYSN